MRSGSGRRMAAAERNAASARRCSWSGEAIRRKSSSAAASSRNAPDVVPTGAAAIARRDSSKQTTARAPMAIGNAGAADTAARLATTAAAVTKSAEPIPGLAGEGLSAAAPSASAATTRAVSPSSSRNCAFQTGIREPRSGSATRVAPKSARASAP